MTNSKRIQAPTPKTSETSTETKTSTTDDVKSPDESKEEEEQEEEKKHEEKQTVPGSNPIAQFFKVCFGHELHNFANLNSFTCWLQRPVDGAALGVFRMLYGASMLIDIAEERGGSQLDVRYGEPQHCHFPLFNGMRALEYPFMGCIYLCMWLGALGIMLGYRFRFSCLTFIMCYWYIFLLDKPAWNNHSYLFGLVGTLLLFTQSNSYWLVIEITPRIVYFNA